MVTQFNYHAPMQCVRPQKVPEYRSAFDKSAGIEVHAVCPRMPTKLLIERFATAVELSAVVGFGKWTRRAYVSHVGASAAASTANGLA